MSRILKNQAGKRVTLAAEIAAGREGRVFRVSGSNSTVAKIYHDPVDTGLHEKLKWMINHPPHLVPTSGAFTTLSWPQDLLFDDKNRVVGYTMPLVVSWPIGRIMDPRLRQHLRTSNGRPFDWKDLHTIAQNLSRIVHACHAADYVIGDLNDNNVQVKSDGSVVLIDTDSFQVRAGTGASAPVYLGHTMFPEYWPPELRGKDLRITKREHTSDMFILGIIIFRLLHNSFNPFTGQVEGSPPEDAQSMIRRGWFPYDTERINRKLKPPAASPPYARLHPDLRKLFQSCFGQGLNRPGQRPKANTWEAALQRARSTLTECKQGHVYTNHSHDAVCLHLSPDRRTFCGANHSNGPGSGHAVQHLNFLTGALSVPPPRPVSIFSPGARVQRDRVSNLRNATGTAPPTQNSPIVRNLLVLGVLIALIVTAYLNLGGSESVDGQLAQPGQNTQQSEKIAERQTANRSTTNASESGASDGLTNIDEPGEAFPPTQTAKLSSTEENQSGATSSSNISRTPRKGSGSSRPVRVVTSDSSQASTTTGTTAPEGEEVDTPISDSGRIVYSWYNGSVWNISIYNLASGESHQVGSGYWMDPRPIFSHDGNSIIYVDHPTEAHDTLIYIYDLTTSQISDTYSLSRRIIVNRIAHTPGGDGVLLSVSDAGGPRVLDFNFSANELREFLPVSSMDMATSNTDATAYVVTERLQDRIVLADEQGNASIYIAPRLYCQRLPVFSPDGSRLAFLYGDCEGRVRRIAVWNESSTVTLGQPNLSKWDVPVSIAWSPSQYVLAVGGCEAQRCQIAFVSVHGESVVSTMTHDVEEPAAQIGSIDWAN